jgi:RNA-binding protein
MMILEPITELTGKQKRYLRAMGSTMDAMVHIGKQGVIDTVITTAREVIGPRELIKVKVLKNCPQDPTEVIVILAEALDAHLVQVIGHSGLLYKANIDKPIIELP